MVVGAIREQFPDIPEEFGFPGATVIYDRQERRVAVFIAPHVAQSIVLETTRSAGDAPFTNLEAWLNAVGPRTWRSEGMPATRREFMAVSEVEYADQKLLKAAKDLIPQDANPECAAWHAEAEALGI